MKMRNLNCLIVYLKLLDGEWPLSSEETDAILEFAPISSQFFNVVDTPKYDDDPHESLAIAGPSTHMIEDGKVTRINVSIHYFLFITYVNI